MCLLIVDTFVSENYYVTCNGARMFGLSYETAEIRISAATNT
jgi:hypothetical protein